MGSISSFWRPQASTVPCIEAVKLLNLLPLAYAGSPTKGPTNTQHAKKGHMEMEAELQLVPDLAQASRSTTEGPQHWNLRF